MAAHHQPAAEAAGARALSWRRQQMLPYQVQLTPGPTGHRREATVKHDQARRGATVCLSANFELAQVLSFSAFPFLAVTALANSGAGKWLNGRLEQSRQQLEAEGLMQEVARERARLESPWYGESRPRFFGAVPFPYPAHLDGTRPGDFGFDPLGLAREPEAMDRLFNLEVIHGRWAMLGALGALAPELIERTSSYRFLDPVWWSVGYTKLQGDDLDYLGIPGFHLAGNQGVAIIAVAQFLLMLGPEYARYTGIKALEPLGVYLPGDKNYPGGWLFDPLNVSANARRFEDLKVREMKNGRLAMLAWVGFAVQALVTERGPLQDWDVFLSDPEKNNLLSSYIGDLREYPGYLALKAGAVGVYSDTVGQLTSSPAFQGFQRDAVDAAFQAQGAVAQLLDQIPLQQ